MREGIGGFTLTLILSQRARSCGGQADSSLTLRSQTRRGEMSTKAGGSRTAPTFPRAAVMQKSLEGGTGGEPFCLERFPPGTKADPSLTFRSQTRRGEMSTKTVIPARSGDAKVFGRGNRGRTVLSRKVSPWHKSRFFAYTQVADSPWRDDN